MKNPNVETLLLNRYLTHLLVILNMEEKEKMLNLLVITWS